MARTAKDFSRADALRDRIADLGYRVIDGPSGPAFEQIVIADVPAARRLRASEVEGVLDAPPTVDISLHWLVEGWPEDVVRALGAFGAIQGRRTVQRVVTDVIGADPSTFGEDVEVISLETATPWGAARNAGLRRSRGRIVVMLDGSIEPTGDVLGPIEAALADPAVGVVGPFGISTTDLREFHPSDGPDVDAIEGYLMAFRRDVLLATGLLDEHFTWYRTADIELCFRLKDAGYRAVAVELPVTRHVHRMWDSTPHAERERLSKRNYYRFLKRFRGRFDLLVEPPASE